MWWVNFRTHIEQSCHLFQLFHSSRFGSWTAPTARYPNSRSSGSLLRTAVTPPAWRAARRSHVRGLQPILKFDKIVFITSYSFLSDMFLIFGSSYCFSSRRVKRLLARSRQWRLEPDAGRGKLLWIKNHILKKSTAEIMLLIIWYS